MTISVSGSVLRQTPAEPVSASAAIPEPSSRATAPTDADSVRLSQAAQVRLLKQQGQPLSEIASNLSIPVATVDGYLGIQVPTPAAAPPPMQSPAQAQSSLPLAKG